MSDDTTSDETISDEPASGGATPTFQEKQK